MVFIKRLFLFFALFLCYGLCQAGELISKEAASYYNEGVKAQKASNFGEAEINYQKTLLLDPYNTDWEKFIINNRGIMYAQDGDLKKAEAAFNRALKIDPDYTVPKLNLGFIYEKRRSKLESIEYWLKVLNINLEEVKPKGFIIEEGQQKQESN